MMTNLKKEPELTEAEQQKFKMLARKIQGDTHFQAILQTVQSDRRRILYYQIKPYLRFKARSFLVYKFY